MPSETLYVCFHSFEHKQERRAYFFTLHTIRALPRVWNDATTESQFNEEVAISPCLFLTRWAANLSLRLLNL
jgi:hypothetical protein